MLLVSCGMCRASARARTVRCRSSSIRVATVLIVRIAPLGGSNSSDPHHLQRLYATAELPNHLMVPSQIPPLITRLFSLGVFFKHNRAALFQRHVHFFPNILRHTGDTRVFCVVCSLFFFLHVNCCTHLRLHNRAFYRLRKLFFPALHVHNHSPYRYINMFSGNQLYLAFRSTYGAVVSMSLLES